MNTSMISLFIAQQHKHCVSQNIKFISVSQTWSVNIKLSSEKYLAVFAVPNYPQTSNTLYNGHPLTNIMQHNKTPTQPSALYNVNGTLARNHLGLSQNMIRHQLALKWQRHYKISYKTALLWPHNQLLAGPRRNDVTLGSLSQKLHCDLNEGQRTLRSAVKQCATAWSHHHLVLCLQKPMLR